MDVEKGRRGKEGEKDNYQLLVRPLRRTVAVPVSVAAVPVPASSVIGLDKATVKALFFVSFSFVFALDTAARVGLFAFAEGGGG